MNELPKITSTATEIVAFLKALNTQKEEQSVETTCALLQQEEYQKGVFGSWQIGVESTALYNKGEIKEKCSICGFKWHPPEKCWKKVGYPPWHHKNKQNQKSKGVAKSGNAPVNRTPGLVKNRGHVVFTSKQFEQLMKSIPYFHQQTASSEMEHPFGEEAVKDAKWCKAMNDELRALKENNTWEITSFLADKKAIACHWIYKTKLKADGSLERKKARLVINESRQRKGVDYGETFAPVGKMVTVKALLAVAAIKGQVFLYIILVYVDDLLITGSSPTEIQSLKTQLSSHSRMKDLEAGVFNAKFYKTPIDSHVKLQADVGQGILLANDFVVQLTAYCNSDWTSCPMKMRSTTGYCILLGQSTVLWKSKKQVVVSRSSTEAEYMAMALIVVRSLG
nr:peptidase family M48 family protein [Tanacetum cinerariifolium]